MSRVKGESLSAEMDGKPMNHPPHNSLSSWSEELEVSPLIASHTRMTYILAGFLTRKDRSEMKAGIHPEYKQAVVTCVCGNTFVTRSTAGDLRLEICSSCHPFFTGRQKLVDSAGRVERYHKKYSRKSAKPSSA
jgi:large subunit ribosomal protein L31